MNYEYDIFLSYSRKNPHNQWVNEVFYPLFVPYVEDALNRKVRVFKDDREILGGSSWDHTIVNSLLSSRIMVPVLSPSYFMSEWCQNEFKIFYYRQLKQGFTSELYPNGLIVPVRINDGDFFPDCVKKIQTLDCRKYFRIGAGFENTARYIELQDTLIEWANHVAHAIMNSDSSLNRHNFEVLDWLEEAQREVDLSSDMKVQKPRI